MEKSSFVFERRVESLHNVEQENFQFFKGAEDLPVLIYLCVDLSFLYEELTQK